jgi:sorting nexin-8
VASLSQQNTLPEPSLDLERLQPSTSTFSPPPPNFRQSSVNTIRTPGYSAEPDPWNAAPRPAGATDRAGTGLPSGWWKRQENVSVQIMGQQGFILNRYTVYQIITEVCYLHSSYIIHVLRSVQRGTPVIRRYSEFSFLWDCLYRRYPFRLFPALPPKRVGRE